MSAPPHPVEFLREILLPSTGRSEGEVAMLMGISLRRFYTILMRDKPISRSTAAMLGRFFRTGDEFWLRMQADYDRFIREQNITGASAFARDIRELQRHNPRVPDRDGMPKRFSPGGRIPQCRVARGCDRYLRDVYIPRSGLFFG